MTIPQQAAAEIRADGRRVEVARLYLEGKTQRQIAEECGVTATTINRDLALIRERWLKDQEASYAEHLSAQLEHYRTICAEAWDAWRESKGDNVTTTLDTVTAANGVIVGVKQKTVSRYSPGDAKFLDLAMKATQKISELLGIGDPEAWSSRGAIGQAEASEAKTVEIVISSREEWEEAAPVLSYQDYVSSVPEDDDDTLAELLDGDDIGGEAS